MRLEFLAEASAELSEAAAYYDSREEGLGWRFRDEVLGVCVSIAQQPLLWRERPGVTGASTALCSRTTWPTSSAAISFWLRRWLMGIGDRTTGRPGYRRKDSEPQPLERRSDRRVAVTDLLRALDGSASFDLAWSGRRSPRRAD
jgi:hypothetical protein